MYRYFSPAWLASCAFLALAAYHSPGRAAAPPPRERRILPSVPRAAQVWPAYHTFGHVWLRGDPILRERRVLHSVTHASHAWTTYRTFGSVWIRVVPLSGVGGGVEVYGDASNTAPPRWHIGHGACWVGTTNTFPGLPPSAYYCVNFLTRYPTNKLLKGHKLTDAEKDGRTIYGSESSGHSFGSSIMPDKIRFAARDAGIGFMPTIYSDAIATGPASVRQFVLSNVRFSRRGAALKDGIRVSQENVDAPAWSMVAYTFKKGDERWWQKEPELEVSFREPFTALAVGGDFYFLTDSGSLYRAPAPARKGGTRRVYRVWNGRRRPVVALVEDADAGRAFLFVGPPPAGGRPAYFAPSASPELVPHDPTDLPKATADPRRDLPNMQEYALALEALRYPRLLVAKGLIKTGKR